MSRDRATPWRRERDAFVRAFAGAFLFGAPLLFTMEMWWIGAHAEPWRLLALLAVAFLANLGLTRFAGFKRRQHATVFQTVDETVDVLAVAAVGALVVLLTLNRIALDDPLGSTLGTIVVQIVPLSLGASVANVVFAPGKGRQGEDERAWGRGAGVGQGASPWRATLGDVGATAIGGIFLGFSVAPTEEIPLLATGMRQNSDDHLVRTVSLW